MKQIEDKTLKEAERAVRELIKERNVNLLNSQAIPADSTDPAVRFGSQDLLYSKDT